MFWHIQTLFRSLMLSFSVLYQAITSIIVFTHFHVEPPYFVCVYISFTFVFYQFYAAVFAESAFLHNGAFLGRGSVSGNPQSGAPYSVLLGFLHLSYLMIFARYYVLHVCIYICIFVFCSTSAHYLLQCVFWEDRGPRGPDNIPATLWGLILLPEMYCVAVNPTV